MKSKSFPNPVQIDFGFWVFQFSENISGPMFFFQITIYFSSCLSSQIYGYVVLSLELWDGVSLHVVCHWLFGYSDVGLSLCVANRMDLRIWSECHMQYTI